MVEGGPGGILWLARLTSEHADALDYDLMTRTRFTLDDLGGALSWRALLHFVSRMGPGFETWADMHPGEPDSTRWDGRPDPWILADIRDILATVFARPGTQPKPWPVPGAKEPGRHWGKGAVPVTEIVEWWDNAGPERT